MADHGSTRGDGGNGDGDGGGGGDGVDGGDGIGNGDAVHSSIGHGELGSDYSARIEALRAAYMTLPTELEAKYVQVAKNLAEGAERQSWISDNRQTSYFIFHQ